MSPPQLLAELERITGIINDHTSCNIAGKVDTLKYDVLPNLLRSEVGTVIKALRVYCDDEKAPSRTDSQMGLF